jgi:hypothetical protein
MLNPYKMVSALVDVPTFTHISLHQEIGENEGKYKSESGKKIKVQLKSHYLPVSLLRLE